MRIALALIAALLILPVESPLLAATARRSTHKKAGAAHKTTARKRSGTATSRNTTRGKSRAVSRRRKGRTTRTAKSRQTWRNRQLLPTPERYQEIQQALVQKGYLKQAPDGQWNQEWVAALQHFQKDQNLQPTGKIDSLSLIALGLGPKHENSASAKPPTTPQTRTP